MRKFIAAVFMTVSIISVCAAEAKAEQGKAAEKTAEVTSEAAMKKLVEGNKRFVTGKAINPDRDKKRREEIASAQHPFVVILTCSDSRVSPEVIFDQGLGDIFEIRDAGNIVDNVVLGSIEYAVEHLHSPLVVVLGHERCGAVSAAVAGGEIPGHIGAIVEEMKESVEKAKAKGGDIIDNAVYENIDATVKKISESQPVIEELVKSGKVKVVGAYYDLDSGEVKFK